MLKTRIRWQREDGKMAEVSSGADVENAIQSVSITECVNSEKELSPGAVCASLLEVKIITMGGSLPLQAGTEVSVYRHDGLQEHFAGTYVVEQPQKVTAGSMQITGYDNIVKLDKDVTAWLNGLDGWPYTLLELAGMVCNACGLALLNQEIPNGNLPVHKFTREHVTGRQLLQWIGQLCCRFCRASREDPGAVEFDWYKPSGKTIDPSGEIYYLKNNLSFEDYTVAQVDAVQVRLAGAEGGMLWPATEAGANTYVIENNPLLGGSLEEDIAPALQTILEQMGGVSYTPCNVTIPACPEIRPGHTVTVTTKNGKQFTACIMTKVQSGQKDILESTGSYRRDAATAGKPPESQYAGQEAVNSMTHEQIFNKLTKDGTIQGIYVQDDKWYINAELAKIVNLIAEVVVSKKNNTTMEISGAKLTLKSGGGEAYLAVEEGGAPNFYVVERKSNNRAFGASLDPQLLWIINDPEVDGYQADAMLGITVQKIEGQERGFLRVDMINDKLISWKDNGDGTFSLIGR